MDPPTFPGEAGKIICGGRSVCADVTRLLNEADERPAATAVALPTPATTTAVVAVAAFAVGVAAALLLKKR